MHIHKKEIQRYFFKGDKAATASFDEDQKKLLDKLKKLITEDNYSGYQMGFLELEYFYEISSKLYERLSERSLRKCHPEQSMPALRRRLIQSFPLSIRN